MEMTTTNHDQVIKRPDFVMSVLRWHVRQAAHHAGHEGGELLFPSEVGTFRHDSALARPREALDPVLHADGRLHISL
jgi:hypothetical protein